MSVNKIIQGMKCSHFPIAALNFLQCEENDENSTFTKIYLGEQIIRSANVRLENIFLSEISCVDHC